MRFSQHNVGTLLTKYNLLPKDFLVLCELRLKMRMREWKHLLKSDGSFADAPGTHLFFGDA